MKTKPSKSEKFSLKYAVILLLLFVTGYSIKGQNVCISSDGSAPNSSAMLEVKSTSSGFLMPRLSLSSLTDASTISSPATSLLVWNTNASLTGGVGYYYNSGTSGSPTWTKLGSGSGWGLSGNTLTGTLPSTPAEWIGTVNAADWLIKTNNIERMRILSTGKIGIGTTTPDNILSLNGDADQTFNLVPPTTAIAGKSLNVLAGYSAAGTNLNGGTLILSGGGSTGTGYSKLSFRVARVGTTGTTVHVPEELMALNGNTNNFTLTDIGLSLTHSSPTYNDGMQSLISGASTAAFSLWGLSDCPTADGTGYGNATANIAVSGQMESQRQYSFGLHAMITACDASPSTMPNNSAGVYGAYTNSATTMQASGALGYKDGSGNFFGVYGNVLGGAGYYAGGFAYDILFPSSTNDFNMRPNAANYGYIGTSSYYYYAMYSNNFIDPSRRELKRNITYIDKDKSISDFVINDIRNMKPAFYKYKFETDNVEKNNESKYRPNMHLGVILDESPDYVQDNEFSGIDIYALSTFALVGAKYSIEKIDSLENEVNELKKIILLLCKKDGIDASLIKLSDIKETSSYIPPIEGLKVDKSKKIKIIRTAKIEELKIETKKRK
jgi:hypothetical protein